MKYIGQHLYDLISRFRGDVYINQDLYLEQVNNVAGGFSGLSTDHKILYLTGTSGKVEYSGDFEYDSTLERLTIGDINSGYAYIARTPRVLGESNGLGGWLALHAGQSTGSALGGLVELGTSAAGSSGGSVNSITEKLILWPANSASGFAGSGSGSLTDYVQVTMPGALGIYADTSGSLGSQPHIVFGPRTNTAHPKTAKLSEIESKGNNSAQELTSYSLIRTSTGGGQNDDTDEHGVFEIKVATSDGSTSALQNAFAGWGHEGNNDVDVSLGYGATSITNVVGYLKIGGHAINDIDLAGEFVDSDEHLMTSAAIDDRIVAATSSTFVDLTSEVSGTLPVASGGTGATSLTDNKLLTGTGTSAVTAEANATYDGADLSLTSATSTKPILSIENTTADASAGELRLIGRRGAAGSAIAGDGDDTGTISFIGENNKSGPDPETITYGKIVGENVSAADGAEMGMLSMTVARTGALTNIFNGYGTTHGTVNTFGDGGALANSNFHGSQVYFTSTLTTAPYVQIQNLTDDATAPTINLDNARGGIGGSKTDGSNGDDCGTINFRAYDTGTPTLTKFASIFSETIVSTEGSETGRLELKVAEYDGTLTTGLKLDGQAADGEIDVTIGAGAASTTTVVGDLNASGEDHTFTSSTSAKPVLTLSNSNTDAVGSEIVFEKTATGANNDVIGNIDFVADNGADEVITFAKIEGGIASAVNTDEAGHLNVYVATSDGINSAINRTGLSLLGSATGNAINSIIGYGAASVATIAGTLTMGSTAAMTNAGLLSVPGQSNITSLGTLTNLNVDNININTSTIATGAGNNMTISASGDLLLTATGNDINVDTDNFTIESAGGHMPYFTLKSTENESDGGHIQFIKDRGAAAVNDDIIGSIDWVAENDAQESTTYGHIIVQALEVDDTDEAGRMTFQVAESNGSAYSITAGLVIEGSDNTTDGEVNVNIAAGAASTTTVAGNLTVTTGVTLGGHLVNDIDVAGEFVDSDEHLMTSAAIDDRIAAAGGSGGGKQTFSFHKRVTVNSSTAKWIAGFAENWYMSAEVYSLATTKAGSNYTDTTASNWATFNYRQFTVAHACTIDSFVCAGWQTGCDADITVGIWKHGAQATIANHSASDAVMDFIGEITFTADADTNSMHAAQTLTSFESGTDLAAGDGVILAVARTGGGTDGTYWYIHGGVGVTYD